MASGLKIYIHIPLLQYADDMIMCIQGTSIEARHLDMCLDIFADLSGLQLNKSKSALMVFHMTPEESNDCSCILGTAIQRLPMNYLGLPLGSSRNSPSLWLPVVDRLEKRLAGWKRRLLSKKGA